MPGIFQPALGAPLVERIMAINPFAETLPIPWQDRPTFQQVVEIR